jgi:hypothetical protein
MVENPTLSSDGSTSVAAVAPLSAGPNVVWNDGRCLMRSQYSDTWRPRGVWTVLEEIGRGGRWGKAVEPPGAPSTRACNWRPRPVSNTGEGWVCKGAGAARQQTGVSMAAVPSHLGPRLEELPGLALRVVDAKGGRRKSLEAADELKAQPRQPPRRTAALPPRRPLARARAVMPVRKMTGVIMTSAME